MINESIEVLSNYFNKSEERSGIYKTVGSLIIFGFSFLCSYLLLWGLYFENEGISILMFTSPVPFSLESMIGLGLLVIAIGLVIFENCLVVAKGFRKKKIWLSTRGTLFNFGIIISILVIMSKILLNTTEITIILLAACLVTYFLTAMIQMFNIEDLSYLGLYTPIMNPIVISMALDFHLRQFIHKSFTINSYYLSISVVGILLCFSDEVFHKLNLQKKLGYFNLCLISSISFYYVTAYDYINDQFVLGLMMIYGTTLALFLVTYYLHTNINLLLKTVYSFIFRKQIEKKRRKRRIRSLYQARKKKNEEIASSFKVQIQIIAIAVLVSGIVSLFYICGTMLNDIAVDSSYEIKRVIVDGVEVKGTVIAIDNGFIYLSVDQKIEILRGNSVSISN